MPKNTSTTYMTEDEARQLIADALPSLTKQTLASMAAMIISRSVYIDTATGKMFYRVPLNERKPRNVG